MNRRRLIATLTLFLFATVAAAPLAFQIGNANGARFIPPPGFPAPVAEGRPAVAAAVGECGEAHWFPSIRQFDRIQDCRPSGEGAPSLFAEDEGALARATATAIARFAAPAARAERETHLMADRGDFGGFAAPSAAPSPILSVAKLRPPPASGFLFPSNIIPFGGRLAGGTPPPAPAFQLPEDLPGAPGPEGVAPGPEPLATPLPPALPFLLVGAMGLGAIARRKRSNA